MFGLTEEEMTLYKDLAQDFAVKDVAPLIVGSAKFITPLTVGGDGESTPDELYIQQLVTDIVTVIMLTTAHMSYEYASLQCDSKEPEEVVLKHLHTKYEGYLIAQFIKYGVSFSQEVPDQIIKEIIMELPYLYLSVIQDVEFDEDSFIEDKMEAYEKYLDENFSDDSSDFGEEG